MKLHGDYTGSLALRLVGAEELLARSEAFRRRVGAADIATAKNSVYFGELTDVLNMAGGGTLALKRPCAILGADRHAYLQIGQGAQIDLGVDGGVWVIFCDNPKDPQNHKLSGFDFCDWFSRCMDEVAELCGQDVGAQDATLWPFNSVRMFLEPFRPDLADRESDDFWIAGYLLSDSINGGP